MREMNAIGRGKVLLCSALWLPMLLPLAGCGGFFQCEKASCSTTGGNGPSAPPPSNTGDYAYVANSSVGPTSLSAYSIGGGKLVSLGSISLGYLPVALAVAPSNSFLYVASAPGATSPGIYRYAIGQTGALTADNGGNALVTDTVAAMTISPEGNWLFTVNSNGLLLSEYQVNTSTGALKLQNQLNLPLSSCNLVPAAPTSQSCSVAVSPSGSYVVASLGTVGDAVFTYTSAAGINNGQPALISSGYSTSNPTGDFSVTLDTNNYAYVAQSNSVSVYALQSLTSIVGEGKVAYAAGLTPRGIALSRNYGEVYTANKSAGTITGFGISGTGILNELAGSPFAGPTGVSALGFDNTGNYMVAVGYDANAGVSLYSIAASGALTAVDGVGSGTNGAYPALVAMTH